MAIKMTRSEKIAANKANKRVEQAYYAGCNGVQINIMDISKVFKHGNELIKTGVDDAALLAGIVAFVETIRSN